MIGTTLLHYLVTAKLGEGGMGVVYRARDQKLDRDVALKVLSAAGASETARRRLLLEAKAASALNHPGIVTIHEVNSDRGVDFIVMELVHGSTLQQLVAERPLPVSDAVDYTVQMARALARAHRAGILHRDLKPGNAIVTDDRVVKILDFGLAKRESLDDTAPTMAPLTLEGTLIGTIGYLSPEQARGEAVDNRSDIFSLAAILYELLTGTHAFPGTSVLSILNSLANDEPRPPSSIRPEVPPALDIVVARGLAKHRDYRYASMEEFAADLRRALDESGDSGRSAPHDDKRQQEAPLRVPRYRTAFFGRERELAEIDALFATPRLVTLVAAGGTGKTRLAFEAAVAMRGRFAGGVFAIELADGGDADVPGRTAAAVLGDAPLARAEGTSDPIGAVETFLAGRRALLVVDNCEHVIATARELISRLGRQCPRLSMLMTSREVLGVEGEHVLHVSPLPASPAARLFCDRATAAGAEIGSSAEAGGAVDDICRRLEGLPLAIELAASRVRTLSPEQIAERLDDALKMLRQRSGDRADRHRSLEAAIRWSYDLLNDDERVLLARMSVFVGGFDLAAAEGVGGEVLDLVESLVDKSLVTAEAIASAARYRLAEPIRQFAAERLAEMAEVDKARHAHFAHFLGVAQASVPQLDEAPRPSLVAALCREHGNFLAAIARARDHDEVGNAATLSRTLHTYWVETGHVAEGAAVLQSLVECHPNDPATLPQVGTLVALESMSGGLQQAEGRANLLRAVLNTPVPTPIAGNLRFALGFVESAAGRSGRAFELWRQAAEELASDPFRARLVWLSAGTAATSAGRFDEARESFARAEACPPPAQGWFPAFLALNRAVVSVVAGGGDTTAVKSGLEDLERLGLRFRLLLAAAAASHAFFCAGDLDAAEHSWRRGLELGREMGHLWACWVTLEFAAWSAAMRDDDRTAARLWGAVDAYADARGYGHWEVIRDERIARIDRVRGRDPEGYARSAAAGASVPLSRMVDEALALNSGELRVA